VLLTLLYFFGRTIPKKEAGMPASESVAPKTSFDFDHYLAELKQKLPESQQAKLLAIENSVTRGNVKEQQIRAYQQLSDFWKDSVKAFVPYAYYLGKAAELEKSEKSLTFAARQFFEEMRSDQPSALKTWKAKQAKELFEKALAINPANDSNTIALGACFIFGNISETPMEGIQKIKSIADKDPDNLYAQLMLGIGGIISGQYSKSIERLSKVVEKEPNNVEAMYYLAEAYNLSNDKANAVKWFKAVKAIVKGSDFEKAINERLKTIE
jgi:tetratricopeptide (TPR) repeat protein